MGSFGLPFGLAHASDFSGVHKSSKSGWVCARMLVKCYFADRIDQRTGALGACPAVICPVRMLLPFDIMSCFMLSLDQVKSLVRGMFVFALP